jgi:hypothetical protein
MSMAVVVVLVFALIEPLFGATCLLLSALDVLIGGKWNWHSAKELALIVLIFAYGGGGAQALLVGIVAGTNLERNNGQRISLRLVLVVSVVSCVFIIAMTHRGQEVIRFDMIMSFLKFALVHIAAGLLCWILSTWLIRNFDSRAGGKARALRAG